MIGWRKQTNGFTIVELLIVVVVIAILAAITIVAYNGIQDRAKSSVVQATMKDAVKQMELAKVEATAYPTTFPTAYKAPSNVIMSLSENGTNFCINAESTAGGSSLWYYDSSVGSIQQGTCSGAVIAGSELGVNPNLIEDTTFQILGTGVDQWGLNVGGGTSSAGTTRAGTSTDPFPNRRVLRITNTAAQSSATFSYIKGPANELEIVSGASYTATYYVRLASGTHNSTVTYYAIMNGSALNASIPYAAGATVPNATWQKVTRTVTATQNGISGTFLYLGVGLNDLKAGPFVLEFQGFELRRI